MKKGFTLVELVIVIIIVGILSIVAVPIYKGYTDRAKESEGKALLGSINTAEKVYFAEFNQFYEVATATPVVNELSIDARANKYYTTFIITVSNGSTTDSEAEKTFVATVIPDTTLPGAGNLTSVMLHGSNNAQPTITGGVSGNSSI